MLPYMNPKKTIYKRKHRKSKPRGRFQPSNSIFIRFTSESIKRPCMLLEPSPFGYGSKIPGTPKKIHVPTWWFSGALSMLRSYQVQTLWTGLGLQVVCGSRLSGRARRWSASDAGRSAAGEPTGDGTAPWELKELEKEAEERQRTTQRNAFWRGFSCLSTFIKHSFGGLGNLPDNTFIPRLHFCFTLLVCRQKDLVLT